MSNNNTHVESIPIVTEEVLKDHLSGEALTTEEVAAQSRLRQYSEETAERVRTNYRNARERQTVEHVQRLRDQFGDLRTPMKVWEAIGLLDNFVDLSDPDVELPNIVHLYQTAEGLRKQGLPDWLQLTGFLHDLGKCMYFRGCDADGTSMKEQFSVVGDTFVVGARFPDQLIFPEFNELNPDMQNPVYNTPCGMYEPHCGFDNCLLSYGHDEYMYQVLCRSSEVSLPPEALYIIRYHSFYPWHDKGCYKELESEFDRDMLPWIKLFNRHDLYTKENVVYSDEDLAAMRSYYDALIDKYLPETLLW